MHYQHKYSNQKDAESLINFNSMCQLVKVSKNCESMSKDELDDRNVSGRFDSLGSGCASKAFIAKIKRDNPHYLIKKNIKHIELLKSDCCALESKN